MTEIYTDGSCRGNRKGAYGIIIVGEDGSEKIVSDILLDTTNNVMELAAMMLALSHVLANPGEYVIKCDSEYVINGLTKWLPGWKRKGYRTASGHAVKNKEIWVELEKLYNPVKDRITIKWVRGHDGNKYNCLIDEHVQGLTKDQG
jgi:ribonuclease HI